MTTINKDIKNLLDVDSEIFYDNTIFSDEIVKSATIHLNKFLMLSRTVTVTVSSRGDRRETDILRLRLKSINGVEFSQERLVLSRDVDGILDEIAQILPSMFESVAERVSNELNHGYRT